MKRTLYVEVNSNGQITVEVDGATIIVSELTFTAKTGSVPQLELTMPFIPLQKLPQEKESLIHHKSVL